MRLRKVKNAQEILNRNPHIVVPNPKDHKGKWHQFFNNNNPIHLEIGMGKGKFLIELATKNPHINYIGIEKFDSVIVRACEKLAELDLENIILLNEDAEELLDFFTKDEITKLYLNFSDPWPKSRHKKRRLTNPRFLKLYRNIIKISGTIELKTDNRNFFEYSIIEINNSLMKIEELSLDLHNSMVSEDIVTTEYEERFKQLNKNIYFVKVRI